MDRLLIKGNANLKGSIKVRGSKNATLPIMVSSLLCNDILKLKNIPKLDDISNMTKLLESYGVIVSRNQDEMILNSNKITNKDADYDIVR